jgi:hypothetical protein
MRSRRVFRLVEPFALCLALAGGCTCGDDEPTLAAAQPAPATAPEPVIERAARRELAPATRTDLPRALPAITVTVDGVAFTVTNAALLASWPPAERARLAETPPPGAGARWPELEVRGEIGGDGLSVPALTEALNGMLTVERMRSGGAGAPSVVAFRVSPETPWSSVVRVLYASGRAGLFEPRFVLASGREEVELRMPLPDLGGTTRTPSPALAPLPGPMAGQDPAEVAEGIRRALEAHPRDTTTRVEVRPETTAGSAALFGADGTGVPAAPVFVLRLAREGLTVTRGTERLAPGCQRVAIGAEPTLPSSSLDATSLRECLAHAGATSRPYTFEATPDTTFAQAVPILEALDDVGSVQIAVTVSDIR